jgi:molybdopterin-guanine dinucleotide biosynthesis protein A
MGRDKARLEWQGSTLLAHACATLSAGVDGPVVVVRSSGQVLPHLPPDVVVADDPRPSLGPLQGLAAGLAVARRHADVAFVCATDLPLLAPAVVRRVVSALLEPADAVDALWEVALPVVSGEWQPLAAAYGTVLADDAESEVVAGRLSVRRFAGSRQVRLLTERDLLADAGVAADDPQLRSFVNVNDEQELARARAVRKG